MALNMLRYRYFRYKVYSIILLTYGLTIFFLYLPYFWKFDEWCELGYRSPNIMIGMQFGLAIAGIVLSICGLFLFRWSQRRLVDIPKYFQRGEKSFKGESGNPTEVTYNEISILILILVMTGDLSTFIFSKFY